MLGLKSVASALVLFASVADTAVPVLVAPALALAVSTVVHAGTPFQAVHQPGAAILADDGRVRVRAG